MRMLFKPLAALAISIPTLLGAITIAERGKPAQYSIVISTKASSSQRYAAEELRNFTKQMTGVELPVITDEKPLPEKAILLGITKHSAKIGMPTDITQLGNDGFMLKNAGGRICIIGSEIRGTLYGVYELLEKYGGCRWYSSWHSRIPKLEKWELPELNDTQIPAFFMREPFWYDMFKGDFAARNRTNGSRPGLQEKHGGKIRFGGGMFCHTFNRLCPPEKYFEKHPEYFSLVKGKRIRERTQLCLTNPDVLKIVIAETLERIRADPTANLYSVSQNDWRNPCECPACKAIDEKEGSHAGTLIRFVNKVAEAVEKEFPDVWIETLAYQYTRKPPKHVQPRHNVVPRLCTIECDFAHPLNRSQYAENKKFMADIKGWSKTTDKLFIWDYTTNFRHYIGAFPNILSLRDNVKVFRDNHVVALFEQGDYNGAHGEFAELKAWLLAKLLWNPDQDVNTLIDDFLNGYYGEAAPFVKEYILALHNLFKNSETPCRIFDNIYAKPEITDDFMRYAELLWHRAESAVKEQPAFLYNVRMSKIPVVYSQLQRTKKSYQAKPVVTADNMIKATGAPPAYVERAAELINLLDQSKERIYIREHDRHERIVQDQIRSVVRGTKLLNLKGADFEVAIAPRWGGTIVNLKLAGVNYAEFTRGGINIHPSLSDARKFSETRFSVVKNSAQRLELNSRNEQRVYTVTNNTLTSEAVFTSTRSGKKSPVWLIPLSLGDADRIYWRSGNEKWQPLNLAKDAICDTLPLSVAQIRAGSLELGCATTSRAVKLDFGTTEIARCDVELNRYAKTTTLNVCLTPGRPDQAGTRKVSLKITPIATAADLPQAEPLTPSRTVFEDVMMRLSREGEWCVRVSDPKAVNHSAIKLLNTHFEWCTAMPFDQAQYKPGKRYKLRMRVRVEAKKGVSGNALWAGVYDPRNKKSRGTITKKTDFFKDDNYIWLDVSEWTPADHHYFWIGPGRFDKERGGSAIEALYLDRIEIVEID